MSDQEIDFTPIIKSSFLAVVLCSALIYLGNMAATSTSVFDLWTALILNITSVFVCIVYLISVLKFWKTIKQNEGQDKK